MSWSVYASFVAFCAVLIVVPGPDFAVVTRNTLVGGRRRGVRSSVGVASAAAVQGLAAAAGLGAVLTRAQPMFTVVKWAGIAYLASLAVQAFRSALTGRYPPLGSGSSAAGAGGWRQGFLSNITNPKVLLFYLAVLPQFLGPHPTVVALVALALTHAVLSLLYLVTLVHGLHQALGLLARRRVRRILDAATGTALLAFGVRLAAD